MVRRFREDRATAAAVLLFLILAATAAWNLFRSHPDVRLAAIRKKGFPVTLSELNTWYQAVPDSRNNARIYERVFALPGFGSFDINWPARGRALSGQEKKQWGELMASNQVALALLHSAQASNLSRYSVDFNKIFSATGGHAFAVISGAKLLCADAIVHAANGDGQQAMGSFKAAGLLADSVAEEPSLIAQIVRVACWSIIVQRVEHAVALTPMTDEELASLQALLAPVERPGVLLRCLAGERAVGIAVFADPVRALADDRPPYRTTESLRKDLAIGLSKSTDIFERDRTFYLDVLGESITAASLPFPERLNLGLKTPSGGAAPRWCSISRCVLPRISSVFASEADMVARLRTAQMALAVERFRRSHAGNLPATLEELVPGYCKSLPVDPFNGKPLCLKALDSGYAICSGGVDRDGSPLEFRIFSPRQ